MDDLTAFVSARLDEEEQWIRHYAHLLNEVHMDNADTPEHQRANVAYVFGQEHFHPDTLMREVAAKRKRLAAYADALKYDSGRDESFETGYEAAMELAVKADAAVWSDHPDYRAP